MVWKVNGNVGRRLLNAISTAETMRSPTRVMMESLDRPQFTAFLHDTLLLRDEDMTDADALCARVSETIAIPCSMPDVLRASNPLEINATSLALCRHMGVDPLRLQLAAFNAKAKATDGDLQVAIDTRRPYGAKREKRDPWLTVRLTFAPGMHWQDGALVIRRTTLPQAMLGSLPGMRASDILQHDWQGWRDLTVRGAACTGDTLTVRMGQQTRTRCEGV